MSDLRARLSEVLLAEGLDVEAVIQAKAREDDLPKEIAERIQKVEARTPIDWLTPMPGTGDRIDLALHLLAHVMRFEQLELQRLVLSLDETKNRDALVQKSNEQMSIAYMCGRYETAFEQKRLNQTRGAKHGKRKRRPRMTTLAMEAVLASTFEHVSHLVEAIGESEAGSVVVSGFRFYVHGDNLTIHEIRTAKTKQVAISSAQQTLSRVKNDHLRACD